jgi:hypothetical protein
MEYKVECELFVTILVELGVLSMENTSAFLKSEWTFRS